MSNQTKYISPAQAKRVLAVSLKTGIPAMLNGSVGCGKTTAVKDFVKSLNDAGMNTILQIRVLGQMDLSDFSLPKEINGRTVPCPAEWIPLAEDEKDSDPHMIIFLDEFDRAPVEVQNITLNLLLDRRITNKPISSKVHFVGAQNGSSDMYTTALSKAAVNRLMMVYLRSTVGSYDDWASENGISDCRRSFQKFKACEIIDDPDFEDISFPTNRSLDKLDAVMQLIDDDVFSFKTKDIVPAMAAGLVGVPTAISYLAFHKEHSSGNGLPDLDQIIKDPKGHEIDYEPSVMATLIGSLVKYTKDDMNKAECAMQWVARIPEEYKVSAMTQWLDINPETLACRTMIAFEKSSVQWQG